MKRGGMTPTETASFVDAAIAAAGGAGALARLACHAAVGEVRLQGLPLAARSTFLAPDRYRLEAGEVLAFQTAPQGSSVTFSGARFPVLDEDLPRVRLSLRARHLATLLPLREPGVPLALSPDDRLIHRRAIRLRVGAGNEVHSLFFEPGTLRLAGIEYDARLGDRPGTFLELLDDHAAMEGALVARRRSVRFYERDREGDVVGVEELLVERTDRMDFLPPDAPFPDGEEETDEIFLLRLPPLPTLSTTCGGTLGRRETDFGRQTKRLMAAARESQIRLFTMPALTHIWHVNRSRLVSSPLSAIRVALHAGASAEGVLPASSDGFRFETRIPVAPPEIEEGALGPDVTLWQSAATMLATTRYRGPEDAGMLDRFPWLARRLGALGLRPTGPPEMTFLVARIYHDEMAPDRNMLLGIHFPVAGG